LVGRVKVLLLYATSEGQTRKIASRIAEQLSRLGCAATLSDATGAIPDIAEFDAVMAATSLHAGRYQAAMVDFLRRHRAALNRIPSVLVSVSLAAASDDPEDREGLARCAEVLFRETGWKPRWIEHVAGAFRFTQYDFLKRWAMKYIAWRRGQPTDTSRDYELTDWNAVDGFVERFVADLRQERT